METLKDSYISGIGTFHSKFEKKDHREIKILIFQEMELSSLKLNNKEFRRQGI